MGAPRQRENFNRPREMGFAFHRASRNTLSISRIKIEPDPRKIGSAFHGAGARIGQKGEEGVKEVSYFLKHTQGLNHGKFSEKSG